LIGKIEEGHVQIEELRKILDQREVESALIWADVPGGERLKFQFKADVISEDSSDSVSSEVELSR
jgi:hypothetical protein